MRCLFALFAAAAVWAQAPTRSVTDPGVVTTRQAITPAGVPAIFQGRVYGVDFGASADELFVLTASHIYRMDWRANKVLGSVAHQGSAGLQGIRFDAVSGKALASGVDRTRATRLVSSSGDSVEAVFTGQGTMIAGGLAVAPGKRAVVPLIFDNKLAVAELGGSGGAVRTVPTAIAPFAAAINKEGTVAWVTNWGGRRPKEKDLTLPTGLAPTADKVVVDARGIASTGSVSRIDLAGTGEPVHVATGLHPTGLAWDQARQRLYVANSNSDTVTVVDTASNTVVRTVEVQPFGQRVAGIAPAAVAVSADGAKVWVACGGINAVVQLRASDGRIEGMIPTGWYPNAISLSPDGKYLAVSTLLGPGSGWRDAPAKRYVHAYRGSVHVVPVPNAAELASYTTAAAENNRMTIAPAAAQAPRAVAAVPIPERAGEPSTIEHVVYIIKENRTYDQVFGDMPKGNGDPSLVMFGEDVTPNHHALADRYVLLDNFYASGGNSADGHQWLTQANETAYCLWPGYAGRSYPFDGTDPIAYAAKGFLWDYALARKKTVRVYGEYAGRMSEVNTNQRIDLLREWERGGADFTGRWKTRAPLEPLNKILAAQFPAYTNAIPDVVRASIFNADVARWEKEGTMPNLVILQLPSDHTFGTRPGVSSPKAMVADNDLALGQVVEALTKTRFWKKMAIFVVEDDAQNGVDHVDGHRTVALVVSPFARRGWVDSTFYSNQSMVKTIELIFGLPTMSLFDLIAHDMRASFTAEADVSTYEAIRPKQDLFELNPQVTALRGEQRRAALDSARMRWDVPDAVPSDRLNRILWHATRGWSTPYPGTRQAVFAPLSVEVEDEDR